MRRSKGAARKVNSRLAVIPFGRSSRVSSMMTARPTCWMPTGPLMFRPRKSVPAWTRRSSSVTREMKRLPVTAPDRLVVPPTTSMIRICVVAVM
jgi:hypothetical protein